MAAKDELVFIFLQFQRALILFAISICNSFHKRGEEHLVISSHILDLEDQKTILNYLSFLRDLQKQPLVQIAIWLHEQLDRSKYIKTFIITILLYSRFIVKKLRPRSVYGPYSQWVKAKDTPSELDLKTWQRQINLNTQTEAVSILVLPNAIVDVRSVIASIHNQSEFKINWYFFGSKQNIENLKDSLNASHALGKSSTFSFVETTELGQEIQSRSNFMDTWTIFQNEPGVLAKRFYKELTDWINIFGPNNELAYSDSDFIDADDIRFHPKFHPDWNLRNFIGQNCFLGLTIARKSIVQNAMADPKVKDWPKILIQLVEQNDDKICHIPKILFHSKELKDPWHALSSQEISKLLKRKYHAAIAYNAKQFPFIEWPLPKILPKVSILIPTKDRADLLETLVNGLLIHTDYPNIEVVIVDNNSCEPRTKIFFQKITKHKNVKVVEFNQAFNFSAINNFGFSYCTGEVLVLLNNDIEIIEPNWLRSAIREVYAPNVGLVGGKLYFKNGFIQHAGVLLGSEVPGHLHGFEHRSANGYCNRLQFPQELSAVTGACMVMKRETFAKIGGFNEKDLAVAYNDIDLCLRIRALGLKVVWSSNIELYHLESASRPPDRRPAQIVRYRREVDFMRKTWSKLMCNDPFYNPNFSKLNYNFVVSIT